MGQGDYSIRIFSPDGRSLASFLARIDSISWKRNNYGKLTIFMSWRDDHLTTDNFKDGNLILVEFESALPSWVGVITLPYRWGGGLVEITAYSAEYLLFWRQTNKGRYFTNETVGGIAEKLVNEANEIYPFPIKIGDIWFEATMDRVAGMVMWEINGRPTPSIMIVDAVDAALEEEV